MITFKHASNENVSDIVDIHCKAFNSFFLTSLGRKFLTTYYNCFIKSNESIVLCAMEDGKVIGFSAAAKECRGFNKRLIRQNLFEFFKIGFNLFFTRLPALIRLYKNITKKSEQYEDNEDYGELYSIGVDPKAQGRGIGKMLLMRTEKLIGVDKLSLTTDYYDNDYTKAFYKKCGYNAMYVFITYPNRKMIRMIKKL